MNHTTLLEWLPDILQECHNIESIHIMWYSKVTIGVKTVHWSEIQESILNTCYSAKNMETLSVRNASIWILTQNITAYNHHKEYTWNFPQQYKSTVKHLNI